ncbi:uncharacterized protein C12orf40 homolog [Microtus oregoni]|uniref:uncharacterized protein C12orf40 homolog n=1 Tax=Microtus oregoni TaxID=111838 RepID=UPI001BB2B398|nr:uncharacterized protein C12orf40 homolog [Microtus oregoni]
MWDRCDKLEWQCQLLMQIWVEGRLSKTPGELMAQHRNGHKAGWPWAPSRKCMEWDLVPHRKKNALTQRLSGEVQAAIWLCGSAVELRGPNTGSSREMNWVGGSRTRVLIKQERRKQKEYFEKNKLKSKIKSLGVCPPVKNPTASLDLLNLYMVNQIASKKKTPETMKRPTHVNMNRDWKIPLRKHVLDLPMSPHCVPSKLCIDDMGTNPETGAFLTKRSVFMGEDCGSLCERRQPDFAMEKTAVQQIWRNDGKAFSNFLEHVIPPTWRHPSSNHDMDSFVSPNMINLLSRDQPGRMSAFHKCGSGSLSDSCVDFSDESHYTGGCINGDLTVPRTASYSPPLSTSYLGTCQATKPYQKEYSDSEINEFRSSFEKDCHLTSCGRKDLESSQSSQSASYSPRLMGSTFSSSSDLVSEDEDQIQQQIEDSNKKDTETADNFCQEKLVDHLGDIIVEDNVKIHNFHESPVKNNTDTFPEFQYNSEHTSQNKISNNCVLQARRCDVGVQTEKELAMGETADVAVQCTIISQCSCKSSPNVPVKEVPSLHKAGSYSEDIRTDTSGGQETLKDNSF